ncbi:unnamed protein product [Schistosoma guineensis]|nr:unnamed protein product [Schistosoma guineensis]
MDKFACPEARINFCGLNIVTDTTWAVGMETIACSADLSWPTSQLGNLVPFGANDTTGKNVTSTSSIEHPGRSGGPGVVPLRLTHLVRDLTLPDVTGCCFELHSSDGRRSCLLRAPDAQEARMWFDAIHSKMKIINKSYLAELNRLLPPTQALIQLIPSPKVVMTESLYQLE